MAKNIGCCLQSLIHAIKKSSNQFRDTVNQRVENFGAQYIAFGIFGVLNYPIYYIVWLYFSYQTYENLSLRLIATILCIFLLAKKYWPPELKPWFSLYWLVTLCFCLPFFFFFMMLKNNGASVWLMSANTILFWLILMVDWICYLFIFLLGIFLALVFYYLNTNTPVILGNYSYGIIAQLLGSFVVVAFFARNRQRFEREKLQTMKSIGATIAHELRTPLGAIKSGVAGLKNYSPELLRGFKAAQTNQLILSDVENDQLEMIPEILVSISDEANHASTIVELLLTNLNPQAIKAEGFSGCSISECVNYALAHYPFLPSQKQKVQWHCSQNLDFKFFGDKLLVVHILFNLLKNALYFLEKARKGNINIWLEQTPTYNRLHFKDTGQGIAPKDLPYIFDRFFTKNTHRGSGIGLAFCKMVMEAHHGKMICQSVEGEYAEFILSFPKLQDK